MNLHRRFSQSHTRLRLRRLGPLHCSQTESHGVCPQTTHCNCSTSVPDPSGIHLSPPSFFLSENFYASFRTTLKCDFLCEDFLNTPRRTCCYLFYAFIFLEKYHYFSSSYTVTVTMKSQMPPPTLLRRNYTYSISEVSGTSQRGQ